MKCKLKSVSVQRYTDSTNSSPSEWLDSITFHSIPLQPPDVWWIFIYPQVGFWCVWSPMTSWLAPVCVPLHIQNVIFKQSFSWTHWCSPGEELIPRGISDTNLRLNCLPDIFTHSFFLKDEPFHFTFLVGTRSNEGSVICDFTWMWRAVKAKPINAGADNLHMALCCISVL